MEVKKRKLTSKIYLLQFDTKKNMAETFLRFQEHYESPEFMGKIFTHSQFKQWYGRISKSQYYEDWDGFNLPSKALLPFKKGLFNPLTKKERKLLNLFNGIKKEFYIVAFHGRGHHLFGHELAHALYATNKIYKNEIDKILKKYKLSEMKHELLSKGGYNKAVLDDEIQAYSVSLHHELNTDIPKKMSQEINNVFLKHAPRIF